MWSAATLALLGVGTVRANGWLFFLCVVAAIGCSGLAVTGGRTPIGIWFSFVAVPIAAGRGLPWLRRGGKRLSATQESSTTTLRLIVSTLVGLVLLVVFGMLFASADAAFAAVVNDILPDISFATAVRWTFLFLVFGSGALGAAYLLTNPTTLGQVSAPTAKRLRQLEWALPVGGVLAMFLAFVAVQVRVLFGDRDYVMQTVGLTFATYARRGFWQLLLITILTLIIMAVVLRKAPRQTGAERTVLRVLLGALAVCSLVVVASALWRMSVYEQAYGYTRLRLFVSAFELWLGGLFVLVLLGGIRLRMAWIPRAVVATAVLTLLALAVLNPDGFIATQNIDRYQKTGKIDVSYLTKLSADAAPQLDRLDSSVVGCARNELVRELKDEDDWREFNIARSRARAIIAKSGTDPDAPCVWHR